MGWEYSEQKPERNTIAEGGMELEEVSPKFKKIVNITAWVLFILYLLVLVYFLFFSEMYGRTIESENYRYNLIPFKEIKRFFQYRHKIGFYAFFINIFGNIMAFIPFGFTLPIISRRNRKFLNIFLLSLELTITVELFQLLLKVGCFDVDDMFLNTVGGVLGYGCFAFCRYLFDFWKRKKNEKRKNRT